MEKRTKVLIVIGVLALIGGIIDKNDATKPTPTVASAPTVTLSPTPTMTPAEIFSAKEEARKKQIESLFSSWDGSLVSLETRIKSGMNDPDSYEHVQTRYKDVNDYISVSTTFRGKNAFGGVVTNTVNAKVSLTGDVLEIVKKAP